MLAPKNLCFLQTGVFARPGAASRVRKLSLSSLVLLCGLIVQPVSAQVFQEWNQDSSGIKDVAEGGDRFGQALAAGDFNCDGYDDLAVGVPGEGDGTLLGRNEFGGVNIIYSNGVNLDAGSPQDQYWDQDSDVDGVAIAGGAEGGDQFGFSLAAGDFNNDGCDDLAIGVPGEELPCGGDLCDDPDEAGAVNVLYGSSAGLRSSGNQIWHQDSTGIKDSVEEDDGFGYALAAGDFNGDGFDDLAIGVPGENGIDTALFFFDGEGAVNVLYGSASGLSDVNDQYWDRDSVEVKGGGSDDDYFGAALAAGDIDGDGYDDLAIGVYGDDPGGAVNVLFGSPGGLQAGDSGKEDELWTQASAGVTGTAESGDDFGFALAMADLDGDGYDDLAIGVPGEALDGDNDKGAVHILWGSASGLAGDEQWLADQLVVPGPMKVTVLALHWPRSISLRSALTWLLVSRFAWLNPAVVGLCLTTLPAPCFAWQPIF